MHYKRPRDHLFLLVLGALTAQANALGLGAVPGTAALGQTLDHAVPVRLEAGEVLPSECVSAEVQVGDQRLAPHNVAARVDGGGSQVVLRVTTSVVIDEPVVSITLSLGCPTRLTRRYVLLADPVATSTPSAPLSPPLLAMPAAVDTPPADAVRPAPPAASAPDARPVASPRTAGGSAAAPAPRPRRVVRRAPDAGAPKVAAPAARPRLKLDPVEPAPPVALITAEMIEAAASAAAAQAASQAAADAASASASRVAALEQSIERLKAESAADRRALLELRQRASDSGAAAQWLPWLAGLAGGLALLAGWLGLKLRRLQQQQQQAWWNSAAPVADAPTASADVAPVDTRAAESTTGAGVLSTAGYTTTRPGTLGPVFSAHPAMPPLSEPVTEPPPLAVERTQALPVGWRDEVEGPRDVSIEELIDLEQQAEFFIVLGQEDAAIDLLVDHLRSTGGGSPMPYLKLLEIYRRRGDHEAYERTRARFNHRFNAYAPDWDTDPSHGRSLEDYPSIVARLQMSWPSPIDAMAELESLLFRKTRGELFDMPAYRDVLFLYSLARDLADREPLETGHVDVLLPISDAAGYTQPMSLEDLPVPELDSGIVPLDNQPTVPVDLDITQPVIPDSLFNDVTLPGVSPSGMGRRRRPES